MGFPGTMGRALCRLHHGRPHRNPARGAFALFGESRLASQQIFRYRRKRAIAARFQAARSWPSRQGLRVLLLQLQHKITPEILKVWTRILEAVDGSVLWL